MCYVNSSLEMRLSAFVGDSADQWELVCYSDADFAGDKETMRSTTGVFLCIRGPHTFVPLAAQSKRQSCVSQSTPEAEIVAADAAVRSFGLPALSLWEVILRRKLKLRFMEDNEATIKIINPQS